MKILFHLFFLLVTVLVWVIFNCYERYYYVLAHWHSDVTSQVVKSIVIVKFYRQTIHTCVFEHIIDFAFQFY